MKRRLFSIPLRGFFHFYNYSSKNFDFTNLEIDSIASSASGPTAFTVISCPLAAASCIIDIILFPFTVWSPFDTYMSASNLFAALTSFAEGRA